MELPKTQEEAEQQMRESEERMRQLEEEGKRIEKFISQKRRNEKISLIGGLVLLGVIIIFIIWLVRGVLTANHIL